MAGKKDSSRRQLDTEGPHYHIVVGGEGLFVVRHTHVWRPPTDVMEDEDAVYVLVEIAGMQEGEFHVTLDDRRLVIGGTRSVREQPHSYHQLEVHYGEFRTEVVLPVPVDEERIVARYDDGFLSVELPRLKPRKVKVTEVGASGGSPADEA
jgi:HSP20 family protein